MPFAVTFVIVVWLWLVRTSQSRLSPLPLVFIPKILSLGVSSTNGSIGPCGELQRLWSSFFSSMCAFRRRKEISKSLLRPSNSPMNF
jgi:hypothetical protein